MSDNTRSDTTLPESITGQPGDSRKDGVQSGRTKDRACPNLPFSYLRRALRNKVGKHE